MVDNYTNNVSSDCECVNRNLIDIRAKSAMSADASVIGKKARNLGHDTALVAAELFLDSFGEAFQKAMQDPSVKRQFQDIAQNPNNPFNFASSQSTITNNLRDTFAITNQTLSDPNLGGLRDFSQPIISGASELTLQAAQLFQESVGRIDRFFNPSIADQGTNALRLSLEERLAEEQRLKKRVSTYNTAVFQDNSALEVFSKTMAQSAQESLPLVTDSIDKIQDRLQELEKISQGSFFPEAQVTKFNGEIQNANEFLVNHQQKLEETQFKLSNFGSNHLQITKELNTAQQEQTVSYEETIEQIHLLNEAAGNPLLIETAEQATTAMGRFTEKITDSSRAAQVLGDDFAASSDVIIQSQQSAAEQVSILWDDAGRQISGRFGDQFGDAVHGLFDDVSRDLSNGGQEPRVSETNGRENKQKPPAIAQQSANSNQTLQYAA